MAGNRLGGGEIPRFLNNLKEERGFLSVLKNWSFGLVIRMKKRWGIFCLALTAQGFALDEAPWLGNVYEFELFTDFLYSQYSRIDHAIVQPSYAYNNYVTDLDISFTLSENIDVQWEINLARTPHQTTYGFRSSALQGRYLLWDDTAGDPLSIALGVNTRAVTGRSVRDVSSPYASYWNGEATLSVGKEFTKDSDWKTRGFLLATLGLANHGSLWDRCKASFEARIRDSHALQAFGVGYFGYGQNESVNIDAFQGWGKIWHGSIDLGAKYSYFFDLWGTISLSYACRVFAYSYPEREQTVQVSYTLPFSLF